MTTGLTLGKYAPFHKGHQYVIETALDEMDDVVVIIYDCPDTTEIPLSVRADWIRDLYPTIDVIEGWTLPTSRAHGDREKEREHEDAIREALDGREINAFYSSEPYGDHMSDALSAKDRRVDPERETVPISGTKIRDSPYKYRDYVADRVYRDMILNVVFLGGPSTGKTTLAEELADTYNTEWMPEYGREYWEQNHVEKQLSLDQLVELAETHLERETKKLNKANEFLFTDTNAITTLLFSYRYHDTAKPRLEELAKQCSFRYDIVFLCETDIPYEDEWSREGKGWRERMQKQTKAYLDRYNIPYITLTGSLDERVETVTDVLQNTEKYDLRQRVPHRR